MRASAAEIIAAVTNLPSPGVDDIWPDLLAFEADHSLWWATRDWALAHWEWFREEQQWVPDPVRDGDVQPNPGPWEQWGMWCRDLTCDGDIQPNPGPVEDGSRSEGTAARFFCPFPECGNHCRNKQGFIGWKTEVTEINHVNRQHVMEQDYPSEAWLTRVGCWVCGHCEALHSKGRPARSEECFPIRAPSLPVGWQPALVASSAGRTSACRLATPLTEPWEGQSLLQDVLSTHRPLLRHVPKGALFHWSKGLANALNSFLDDRTWESLVSLLAYTKTTLAVPHRGGVKHKTEVSKEVLKRVEAFASGQWLAMWKEAGAGTRKSASRQPKRHVDGDIAAKVKDVSFLRSLQGFLDDGAYGKAAKHLL